MAYRDYYNILGVNRRSTQVDIKQAYRDLARKWHPDRHAGDTQVEERFKDINEAYNTLGDPERRARYDKLGPFYTESGRPPRPDEVNEAFSSMVGSIFRRKPKPSKGTDLRYTLSIDLEDTLKGVERVVTIPRTRTCPTCEGVGAESDQGVEQCGACKGTGLSKTSRVFKSKCYHCNGMGYTIIEPCTSCDGDGILGFEDTIKVNVAAGIATGQKLRISGKGNTPKGRGTPGDLFVVVSVKDHPLFRRRGKDLIVDCPLSIAEITNGADVRVPTLEGSTTIRIPKGTLPGHVFRLSGKGLPTPKSKKRGDLHIHATLEVPTQLSSEQSAALNAWCASLSPEQFPERAALNAALRDRK